MKIYMIKRSQIECVYSMNDYVKTVDNAFKLYGKNKVQMPSKVYLYFDKGDLRCMPVYIPSMKIAGVKNVNVHPNNKKYPVVMATITLFDPDTGFPLAILDGTYITKMRTGAAGGVAAKYLARKDSKTAAFIGAGDQAKTQLSALLVTRPEISRIIIYDIDKKNTNNMVNYIDHEYSIETEITDTIEDAAKDADIIVTTTPVRKPILTANHIKDGMHINAIGADANGKQELDIGLLKKSSIIVDNWEQASHSGEINVGISNGEITRDDIYGDIGEIVTGKKPGRQSDEEITIFDSTGLAVQDITTAYDIYKKLTSDKKERDRLCTVQLM